PPSQLEPSVPPDLERIIVRALSRDLAQRYSRAGELCADLRALQLTASQQTAQMPGADARSAPRTLTAAQPAPVPAPVLAAPTPPAAAPQPPAVVPPRTLRTTLRPATLEPASSEQFGFPGSPTRHEP
ncbi:MAG: hypothetical protein ACRDHP_09785, partial [Ktedonobacterales bacterium]